jgi:hypothetical protein
VVSVLTEPAKAPVTVWVYDGSLKVEHQAVTVSQYQVSLQKDHKRLREVSNPRLVETPFRSPQLTLWTINADEWLLYWRAPDPTPARRKRRVEGLVQPLLFDLQLEERAVGANETGFATSPRSRLHVVPMQTMNQETEE